MKEATRDLAKILVVDDDALMRMMLGRALRRYGYDVVECADGVEAFGSLEACGGRALLVLDYEMPKFNGAQVCEIIRTHADPAIAQAPIILLTAHAGEPHEVRCLEAGADDFVTKPVNLPVLRARIETHLRVASLRAQLQAQNRQLETWRLQHGRDMEAARLIQQALLPSRMPRIEGWEFAGRYESLIQVGGDIYDWLPLPDGGVLLWMADATGHGVSAALLTTFTKLLFRYATAEAHDPAGVLRCVNRDFRSIFKGHSFITAACVEVQPGRGVIRAAGAGHPPMVILRRGGKAEAVYSQGPPVGLLLDSGRLETETLTLEEGDTALLFTDGIYDLKDRTGGRLAFSRFLQGCQGLEPRTAQEAADGLLNRGRELAGATGPEDDAAILAARRLPLPAKRG